MTKEVTNHAAGPRGINLEDGSTVWIEAGETRDISALKVKGNLPDFGKPRDQGERDASELQALRARVAELEAAAAGKGERKPALTNRSKADLLDIAKNEGVDIADDATNAQIVEAIEAKRAG